MIKITNPKDCCGCNACAQGCPRKCIILQEDSEGFLYPKINLDTCINCGLCEKLCPILNQKDKKTPLKVYATINKNKEVREQSSSGGIFNLLATHVIQNGGVVFGARFNEKWEVIHDYTDTLKDLSSFQGSKYVQSYIGNSYAKAEYFLKSGREVLFSGTPCQLAGLKQYLKKNYANLLAVDFVCHGVPSPKVWKIYLQNILVSFKADYSSIDRISFRDKTSGWKNFSLRIDWKSNIHHPSFCETLQQNLYLKGFLCDLYLRPSCYQCPTRNGKSGSDITIADYWNIQSVCPDLDDDKGTSLVLINSEKGKDIFNTMSVIAKETSYKEAQLHNGGFKEIVSIPPRRELFFLKLNQNNMNIDDLIRKTTQYSLSNKLKRKIRQIVKRIFK